MSDPAKTWYDFEPPDNTALSNDNISWSTITFNLDTPEGERRLRECLDAPKVMAAVREYEGWLRLEIDNLEATGVSYTGPVKARDRLFEFFNERGLSPWDE